jgi:hypothetical protein
VAVPEEGRKAAWGTAGWRAWHLPTVLLPFDIVLQSLIKQYSEFISFPIKLWVKSQKPEQVRAACWFLLCRWLLLLLSSAAHDLSFHPVPPALAPVSHNGEALSLPISSCLAVYCSGCR